MTDIQKSPEPPAFPPGVKNAWRFSIFNALSFQIVLGSPMILLFFAAQKAFVEGITLTGVKG